MSESFNPQKTRKVITITIELVPLSMEQACSIENGTYFNVMVMILRVFALFIDPLRVEACLRPYDDLKM